MWQKLARLLDQREREELIQYCQSRYGVRPDFWESYAFIKRKEGVWVLANNCWEQTERLLDCGEVDTIGLRLFSGREFPYKPTHQFPLFLKEELVQGRISIDHDQAKALLKREALAQDFSKETHPGYYMAYYKDQYIGIALLSRGQWVSQVPKSLCAQLSNKISLEIC